uniref:lysozyme n=1 Tax=Eisenia andrei TaxID=168636 RepID=Q0ZME1_9ANNE|nr:lysozyme [Eisenia andrei]
MFIYFALSCILATAAAQISENCLNCICQIEGCESQIGKCRMDVGSLSCGPFQIKEPYWIDCGRPGGDWKSCTTQMDCSRTCVRSYMKRYGTYCTGGRAPTCQDYARIHNGGPKGCQHASTVGYWNKVKQCCSSKPGGCGLDHEVLRFEGVDIEEDTVYRQ